MVELNSFAREWVVRLRGCKFMVVASLTSESQIRELGFTASRGWDYVLH